MVVAKRFKTSLQASQHAARLRQAACQHFSFLFWLNELQTRRPGRGDAFLHARSELDQRVLRGE